MSKLELSGCCITSGALDGNAHTSRVTPGKTYGHVVSITEYWQLVARNIEIVSNLFDMKQLEFDSASDTWQWQVHFDPFTPEQQEVRPLRCHFPKMRLSDTIMIDITGDDAGQLGVVLDIG
jgi:hypothetical protein